MRFIVTGCWVEIGALLTTENLGPLLEHVIIPSLQMLASWEEQGTIQGGVYCGERETTFVLESSSHEEVGTMLTGLPFWGMMKWNVRPIQSFASAVAREQAGLQRAREMLSHDGG